MFSKINLIFYILLIIIIIVSIIKYIHNRNYNNYDFFESPKSTVQFTNDGTQLYGSLFLDKLNNVVTNMTDPPIKYDTKRFELFRYSDILL